MRLDLVVRTLDKRERRVHGGVVGKMAPAGGMCGPALNACSFSLFWVAGVVVVSCFFCLACAFLVEANEGRRRTG